MSKVRLAVALSTLTVSLVVWAVPLPGAAQQRFLGSSSKPTAAKTSNQSPLISPIRLRDESRGLLVDTWINGSGPFTFAVDTGAGITIVTRSVADRSGLKLVTSRRPLQGGLSASTIRSNQESSIAKLALGERENTLPSSITAAVVVSLPGSIDGILDPTQAFNPLGYTVDFPGRQLRLFDSRRDGTIKSDKGGAVVKWVKDSDSDRPYVRLGDGRLALLDTGSSFGLAFTDKSVGSVPTANQKVVEDLGGGKIHSRKLAPETVSIGSLVLRNIPTDLITGAAQGTPVILGRRALYPFTITFDPVARMIAINPSERRE